MKFGRKNLMDCQKFRCIRQQKALKSWVNFKHIWRRREQKNKKLKRKKKRHCCWIKLDLKPQGPSFLEKRDQTAIDMRSHNPVHGPHQLPANKDDGHRRRGGSDEPHQSPFNFFSSGVVVQLVHRWAHSHSAQQPLQGVAHAAAAHAEYHHCAPRRQPDHPVHWVSRCRRRHVVVPWALCLVMHHFRGDWRLKRKRVIFLGEFCWFCEYGLLVMAVGG